MLEGVASLAILWALARFSRRSRREGDKARLFLVLYSACQITLESLRRDHCLRWLFVRVSQLTAILVIAGLMLAATVRWLKNRKTSRMPGKRLALCWIAVVLLAAVIMAIEFSFDGKILRDLPVWAGYLIMVLCCAGIGRAAWRVIKE